MTIFIKSFIIVHLLAFQTVVFENEFSNNEFIIQYNILESKDSFKLNGVIKFKSGDPALNTNIWVEQKQGNIGTVPGAKGEFSIIANESPSDIYFHLIPYKKFKIPLNKLDK